MFEWLNITSRKKTILVKSCNIEPNVDKYVLLSRYQGILVHKDCLVFNNNNSINNTSYLHNAVHLYSIFPQHQSQCIKLKILKVLYIQYTYRHTSAN